MNKKAIRDASIIDLFTAKMRRGQEKRTDAVFTVTLDVVRNMDYRQRADGIDMGVDKNAVVDYIKEMIEKDGRLKHGSVTAELIGYNGLNFEEKDKVNK